MIGKIISVLASNPTPALELGFGGVYGSLAVSALVNRDWMHLVAYGVATGLAVASAASCSTR